MPDTHVEESLEGARQAAIFARVMAVIAAVAFAASPSTASPVVESHDATLAELFPAADVEKLARTLPATRAVHFRMRAPVGPESPGVLVYVSPFDSGELPAGWAATLDARHLIWIAADGFGNRKPTAQRMLVALMALKLAERGREIDDARVYVVGMSGGGRVASQTITHFPRLFSGAIYIVGADFWMPEPPLRELALGRGYVFLTGSDDFNHAEMLSVFEKYRAAGAARVHMMDLPRYGHELPGADLLGKALDLLAAP